jgi:hypothetical protein
MGEHGCQQGELTGNNHQENTPTITRFSSFPAPVVLSPEKTKSRIQNRGKKKEQFSEYILAHTGPRELDGHFLGGCGSGFGLVPGYTTLSVRVRANT